MNIREPVNAVLQNMCGVPATCAVFESAFSDDRFELQYIDYFSLAS